MGVAPGRAGVALSPPLAAPEVHEHDVWGEKVSPQANRLRDRPACWKAVGADRRRHPELLVAAGQPPPFVLPRDLLANVTPEK